jgi:hypothetical protein
MYFTTPDNPSSTRQAYEFAESEPTTMQDVLSTSDVPNPNIVLQPSSTTTTCVLTQADLPLEDKMILYAVLQEIANELRSIKRERKNPTHHEEGKTQS